jgi:fatty-acyl-CoA synthase
VSGATPVPVELARRCEEQFGVPFAIVFGTTECSCVVTQTHLDDPPEIRSGTLGTPLPHTEVLIADPVTGRPVPTGTVGELCARGFLLMHGYFDDPEATAGTPAAFVQVVPGTALTEAELHAYCRQHLAAFKTPTSWTFVDGFPLTASGKIRKHVLREGLA